MRKRDEKIDFTYWLWIIFISCLILIAFLYFYPSVDIYISAFYNTHNTEFGLKVMRGISNLASLERLPIKL